MRELAAESARFAAGLRAAGIERERRIALVMLDTVDFPIAFWGALRAGVVPVPINTLLPPEITGYILRDSRAAALFVSAPLLEPLREAAERAGIGRVVVSAPDGIRAAISLRFSPVGEEAEAAECSPDEVAFWLYSSGSTGAPKGVRHVHSSLRATAETYGTQVLGIAPDDLMFSAAKLFFAYGLGNSMTFPMAVGAASVLLPERPTPDAVLATMRRYRPTIFAGVPTLYAALLAHPEIGTQGPGPTGCAAASRPASRCPSISACAGASGSGATSSTGSARPRCCTSSCRTGPTTSATAPRASRCRATRSRIVDESGHPVADGEPGELIVSGPSAAEGYWNQREKSRRTFRGEWTHTGDTYTRDADGYYRYNGRSDDMLKVGGIWVSPFEVEEALIGHKAVLEAAVVGHAGRGRADQAEGVCRAAGSGAGRGPGGADRGIAGARQDSGSACGNTRAGSSSATACRRPRPGRSSGTDCATRKGADHDIPCWQGIFAFRPGPVPILLCTTRSCRQFPGAGTGSISRRSRVRKSSEQRIRLPPQGMPGFVGSNRHLRFLHPPSARYGRELRRFSRRCRRGERDTFSGWIAQGTIRS